MTTENTEQTQHGVVVQKSGPKKKRPPMYKVVMLNDDYTPMNFVVEVLQRYFAMSGDMAGRVMLEIHYRGRAVCGVFSHDVAETKAAQVMDEARNHEYPLMCDVEEA